MLLCIYTHITLYMYVHGSRHAIPSLSKTLIHVTQACLNRFRPLLQSTNPLIFISVALFPVSHQLHNSHVAWSLFQIASIIVRYILPPSFDLLGYPLVLSLSLPLPLSSHLISHYTPILISASLQHLETLVP